MNGIQKNLAYTAGIFQVLEAVVIRSMDHTLWPENPCFFLIALSRKSVYFFPNSCPSTKIRRNPKFRLHTNLFSQNYNTDILPSQAIEVQTNLGI
jgi:hypothetical protein